RRARPLVVRSVAIAGGDPGRRKGMLPARRLGRGVHDVSDARSARPARSRSRRRSVVERRVFDMSAATLTPPFKADQVGSLLRPPNLLEAREKRKRGELTAADLRRIEDEAIRDVVAMQERIGLQSVTDGEFRRGLWHMDFVCDFANVEQAPG